MSDHITEYILEHYYSQDGKLKSSQRISAIVGACYLVHLRNNRPEEFGSHQEDLLEKLLDELELPEDQALSLLEEINRGWEDRVSS